MSMTAEIVTRDGKHLLEFPDGFEVADAAVTITRNQSTGDIVLHTEVPLRESRSRDHEELFRRFEKANDVGEDCLRNNDALTTGASQELAKPHTLDRFFALQREVGAGEQEFLADRDRRPAEMRDCL